MRQVPAVSAAIIAALVSTSPVAAFNQAGIASTYGPNDPGGRFGPTGKRIDHSALTAAHKTLPLGTLVEVVNKRNGRAAVVTITDRGPYVRGRIIDLTAASAAALGLNGLDPVRIGIAPEHGCTFAERYSAGSLAGYLRARGRAGCPLADRGPQLSARANTAIFPNDGAVIDDAGTDDAATDDEVNDSAVTKASPTTGPSVDPVHSVSRSLDLALQGGALALMGLMMSVMIATTWRRSLKESIDLCLPA
jgi:rare lipoprotein A